MADEHKDKKEQDGSLDFFLDFMKKRKEQENAEKKEPDENNKRNFKQSLLESVYVIVDAINHVIEDILMNDRKSKWLSLLLAIILFVSVSGSTIATNTERTIDSVPLEVLNLDENYAVSGFPETVSLTMSGNIVNLQSALYKDNYKAYIDLQGYTEGNYSTDIKVSGLPSGITVTSSPGTVNIVLAAKESRVFALGYKFINENLKDAKYVLEPPTISQSDVTVTASRETLDMIRSVQAVIDVRGVSDSFTQKSVIKAFDEYNNELNVEVEPVSADVSVSVTSSSKQVPIRLNRIGTMEGHLAIASMSAEPSSLMIYGRKEILDEIDSVTASVDVSQINENRDVYGIQIENPTGVSSVSVDSITVSVVVESRIWRNVNDVPVRVLNNTDNRTVIYNETVAASVSGAVSRVGAIDASTLSATIDVKGLTAGEYEVPITLRSTDSLLDVELYSGETMRIVIE